MKIVGLTGGIGSGKTTIAGFFKELGVPVYVSDVEAKRLMTTDEQLIAKLITLFGEQAYDAHRNLNRAYIASIVFNDSKMLSQLNHIVHPAVAEDFVTWASSHDTPYVIKEAAVLFENDGYRQCDFNILVTAPQRERIARVQKRDNSSVKDVLARIKMQWPDVKKATLADVVINNITLERTKEEVIQINRHLLRRLSQGWSL